MGIKEDIINRLSIFKNFYDEIRIIGPVESRTNNVKSCEGLENCCNNYVELNNSTHCNCACSRAYYSNDTVINFDYKNGEPVSITASPINIDGNDYIVEMIKKLSKNDLLSLGMQDINVLQKIDELNYKVIHDDLTNVYNRRYIDEKLQKAITSSCDRGSYLSIIMCDIDSFKCINDTYGHQCGDEVLKCFAGIINEKAAQMSGWTGRYGGEEFVCLIPDKNADEAYEIAESMRSEFEKSFILFEGKQIKTTASFGIASISPRVEMSSKHLLKIADTRLYMAKEHGRNYVEK